MGYKKAILILTIVVIASIVLGCSASTTSDQNGTPTPAPTAKPTSSPTPTPQPAQAGTSKNNPAPLGTAVAAADNTDMVPYSAKVTLLEYQSGQNAYNTLKSWDNILLDEPDSGKEYHLIKVKFELLSTKNDAAYYLNPLSFDAVTSGNVYSSELMAVPTNKGISGEMYPGANREGWIAYQLPAGSSNVLITFDRNSFDGTVKAWLNTV